MKTEQAISLMDAHYDPSIQLPKNITRDILRLIRPDDRMLVFGAGLDSKLWRAATDAVILEDDPEWCDEDTILYDPPDLTVEDTRGITNRPDLIATMAGHNPPTAISGERFDIILVDGPKSYELDHPGRTPSIYWARELLADDGVVIIDDTHRLLESQTSHLVFGDFLFVCHYEGGRERDNGMATLFTDDPERMGVVLTRREGFASLICDIIG